MAHESAAAISSTNEARYSCSGDWDGDGFADLVLFQEQTGIVRGTPAASVSVHRGGPNGYELPFYLSEPARQREHELVAFASPRDGQTQIRDLVVYPYVSSSAEPTCGGQWEIRSGSRGRIEVDARFEDGCPALQVPHVGDMTGDGVVDQVVVESAGVDRVNALRFTDGRTGHTFVFEDPAAARRGYMGIGDLNHDGADDLLAWDATIVGSEMSVDVFYGAPAGPPGRPSINDLAPTSLGGRMPGDRSSDHFRVFALAAIGDVNGDARPDFSAHEIERPPRDVSLLLLSQPDGLWIPTEHPRLEAAGDINCDGYDDAIERKWVRAGHNEFKVYLGGPEQMSLTQTLDAAETFNGTPFLPIFGF